MFRTASQEHSPPSPPRKSPLAISNVANIIDIFRQGSSPTRSKQKSHHLDSNSGEPQTHPSLVNATCVRKEPVTQTDLFICLGAVDMIKLLRASRSALLDKAVDIGANVLVEEQWSCTICGPKHRANGTFKVQIRYSALATRSQRPDPGNPVRLERAKGVPGLMTILERD